jgi:CDP-4-dehydro-6-deoxyglucose reductase, E1
MSSFSTYFGHHISTIEGGFVSTNDSELYEVLKSIRSHGWTRDASDEYSIQLKNEWDTIDFDALYTFYHSGFNLRSTDLQAFIGLGQIDKLDSICERRNQNFKLYERELNNFAPHISNDDTFVSNFAYPVISSNRNKIVKRLQSENIEVRPLICGSMSLQPFYIKQFGRVNMPNASIIHRDGFYIPNHPDLSEDDILKITDIIKGVDEEA